MTSTPAPERATGRRRLSRGAGASPWWVFARRKIAEVLVALALLLVTTFVLVLLVPGDPARVIAGADASPAEIEQVRDRMGLEDPILVQFWNYLVGVFTGDLGRSFRTNELVTEIIAIRLPFTLNIAVVAITIALVAAIVIGMTVAGLTRGNRNRWLDVGFSWVSATLQTQPVFLYGALLVVVFAVILGWLPAAGARDWTSYILPTIALSIGPTFSIARIVRREAGHVLETDYMRTARGWRIGRVRSYLKYALPNLLASTLTLSGLILSNMIGGAIIVESVFSWPGLGNGVVDAILERDYPVIRGIILTIGVLAIFVNLVVDTVLAIVDPRTIESDRSVA